VAAGAAALLAVTAGIFALAAQDDPGTPGRDRRPRAASRDAGTSPSPVLTAEDGFDAIDQVVSAGAEDGGISLETGAKLLERSQKARSAYLTGDVDASIDELAKAQEEVGKALDEGEITQPWAVDVSLVIGETSALLEDLPAPSPSPTPTPDEEEEENGGPGKSEFAPGHNKGKGKGEDD
jgi:hypothetical protein